VTFGVAVALAGEASVDRAMVRLGDADDDVVTVEIIVEGGLIVLRERMLG
jgi:hypothetical protein